MIYLLDANAISDLMTGDPRLQARVAALSRPDELRTCTTVRGENLLSAAALAFQSVPCDPIPIDAADRYATIKLACQRRGRPGDENDLWIAATAQATGAVVVSREGDIHSIPGLTAEDWTR